MTFAPKLLLHPVTRQLCEAFLTSDQHALVLHGHLGTGLYTLATSLAHTKNPAPDGSLTVRPEDGRDISIEQIRALYSLTKTVRTKMLTVIIDDADTMGIPAQNAFLKLLEEPPTHVTFILTTHLPHILLETIRSRTAMIEVRRTPTADTDAVITAHTSDPKERQQLMFLASGLPAHLRRLISNPEYFKSQTALMRSARSYLQASVYERFVMIKPYLTDRQEAEYFIQAIALVLQMTIAQRNPQQNARLFDLLAETIDQLRQNGNVRLLMMKLSFSLVM